MHKYRTHLCGVLSLKNVGSIVKLSGWIHNIRNHGSILFIDLRDSTGIIQLVLRRNQFSIGLINSLSLETVIYISGVVAQRSDKNVNYDICTGEIEVQVCICNILSYASDLPFMINSDSFVSESLRLKYRFLYLRKFSVYKDMVLRSKILFEIRNFFNLNNFLEFNTPVLTTPSDEGARNFLVLSSLYPKKFYALPQAPQQFKQMLMIAGFDKYFQIAPCFRDEAARANRSPAEFYQLDIEMSFVHKNEIFGLLERFFRFLLLKFCNRKIILPFVRLSYIDALLKYGSDKPDLRNPLQVYDVTLICENLNICCQLIKKTKLVKCILVQDISSHIDECYKRDLFTFNDYTYKILYVICKGAYIFGSLCQYVDNYVLCHLKNLLNINLCYYMLVFIFNINTHVDDIVAMLRDKLGKMLNLINNCDYRFCWIYDSPFYKLNEKNKIVFKHNPFSMLKCNLVSFKKIKSRNQYLSVIADQYDLVCNGVELASGAVRNISLDFIYEVFKVVGYSKISVNRELCGMVNAFKFGVPPHAGVACGIERILMLIMRKDNIRDVTLFPMNQHAKDVMMSAPQSVLAEDLNVYQLKFI